ncbi:MAG: hypothetical protein JWQ87_5496 [Candidatus Sulfotelmatobacter sp.]|nr:hypothetical protein [Candidatus Sulfotelmatobacter sp.]
MYDSTFSIWFAALTVDACSHNAPQSRFKASPCPDLYAEAYWDGTRPTVAAMTRWNCGDDSWLTGKTLESAHVEKLKRGRGRGLGHYRNQIAA